MQEDLEFLIDDAPREEPGGIRIPWSVVVSLVFHVVFLIWFVTTYKPVAATTPAPTENLRFRKASMPKPTGDQPTLRPGENNGMFVPSRQAGDGRRAQAPSPSIQQAPQAPQNSQGAAQQAANATQELMQQSTPNAAQQVPSAMQPFRGTQTSAGPVNLRQAIREVSKVASLGGGQQGLDLGNAGGEKGYAAEGPLSFETQWYDWGEYAEGMVNRIRVNWYANMPMPLLQTGLKGVLTIRFTIHRDGHLTDITMLTSSGIPPYDFAAKKAIELSSPLAPLPKDFPEETERVTCMFYYNSEPPKR